MSGTTGDRMTGAGLLLAAMLRRDRLVVLLWILGIAGLWAAGLAGVSAGFDESARRQLVALLAAQPALMLVRGAPSGTGLGAVLFVSTFAYLGLMIALMMTFFGVRHSRGDEDAGRAELIRGTAVGRWATLTATVAAGAIELVLVCGVVLAASLAFGLPARGAWLMAVGLFGLGALAMLVGLLAGQAMPTSRSANSTAAMVVGAWFIVRGIGDAMGEASADLTHVEPAWPVWASPIGWVTVAHPFADAPWSPDGTPLLLLLAAAAVALGVVVVLLESRRELGRSLFAERAGRARGSRALGWNPGGAPIGLVLRLQLGITIAWIVVGAVIGALAGRIGPVVADALGDNPAVLAIIERLGSEGGDTADLFISALAGVVVLVACAAALQGTTRLRHEEVAHGEVVLATTVRRRGWMVGHTVIAGAAALATLAAFTVSSGISIATAGESRWQQLWSIALSQLPLVAIYLAVGAALVAFLPSTVSWLGWVLLFGLMLAGQFAPLFGEAWEWVENLSPFHWVADPLAAEPDWTGSWWLLGIAAVMLVAALWRYRRRDALV